MTKNILSNWHSNNNYILKNNNINNDNSDKIAIWHDIFVLGLIAVFNIFNSRP